VLRWRLLSATLIIAPLLGLMVADFSYNFGAPGIWLAPLALLITAAAVAEMLDCSRAEPAPVVVERPCRCVSWSFRPAWSRCCGV
jgi:hypothetical protein